ncbi:hypothetical protein D1872_254820 [compost metagenome]
MDQASLSMQLNPARRSLLLQHTGVKFTNQMMIAVFVLLNVHQKQTVSFQKCQLAVTAPLASNIGAQCSIELS